MQGQLADSLYFLLQGKVQLAVASQDGKEAIVATIGAGEFFGEGCLAGQPLRMGTAIAVGACRLTKVEKTTMAQLLHDEQGLAEIFVTHLLSRIVRYEADLVDQIFNSSEKRLARILLLLSHFGKESKTETRCRRHQSGAPGADGRHHPVADQPFHEQVQEAGLYRLQP